MQQSLTLNQKIIRIKHASEWDQANVNLSLRKSNLPTIANLDQYQSSLLILFGKSLKVVTSQSI